jgi:hypothetical protein
VDINDVSHNKNSSAEATSSDTFLPSSQGLLWAAVGCCCAVTTFQSYFASCIPNSVMFFAGWLAGLPDCLLLLVVPS